MAIYCGHPVTHDDILIENGTNDEGEEYGRASFYCTVCNKEYAVRQWTHYHVEADAFDDFAFKYLGGEGPEVWAKYKGETK